MRIFELLGCGINDLVYKNVKEIFEDKGEILISDYVKSLHKAVMYFAPEIQVKEIERAVYFFFMDLQMHECVDELYELIGASNAKNPYLSFLTKPDLKILNPKKMSKHSYFILKTISDKKLCQVFMKTSIKKFDKRVYNYDQLKVKKNKPKKEEIKIAQNDQSNQESSLFKEVEKPSFMDTPLNKNSEKSDEEEEEPIVEQDSVESELEVGTLA